MLISRYWLSIKDGRCRVGGGLSIADIFGLGGMGFFRYGRLHFFAQKNFGYFEINGVLARTRGG